jgi:outer membrane protein assembly factor BamB
MRVSKIVSFSVVLLLITVLFAGALTVPTAAQYDTMQFHYNAQHTGDYSPVAGAVPPNGKLKWNYTIGQDASSSPAIANGVVYVGSYGGVFYALDATTGKQLWNFITGYEVVSSPAVVNGVVYFKTHDGYFYALNAFNGTLMWRYNVATPFPGSGESSPAVANNVAYIVGPRDLFAFNATTGAVLWNRTTYLNHTSNGGPDATPAYSNGIIYVAGSEGGNDTINAFYANNGTKEWSYSTPDRVCTCLAVANDKVYFGAYSGNVTALNASTGAYVWSRTLFLNVASSASPAVANGVVYVGNPVELYGLNVSTGAVTWVWTGANGFGLVGGAPSVANGIVYIGSEDNNLYAINASTHATIWNYTTGNYVTLSPAIVNGVVYFASRDGNVYALGTQSEPTSLATILSATANPKTVAVNNLFAINGTLTTRTGAPISGATIQLQKNVSGTWTKLTGKTNTTTATGTYRISTSESSPSTYQYRATYAGNITYANATSNVVSVKVVSKTSVLADINALKNTINHLPNSAFIPGTKTALLSLLSATELQVKFNLYGSAATTLQKAVLPRMDGCAKTGKPDSDDWVRTCAAQSQLYPQVQNLIQELHALQGS